AGEPQLAELADGAAAPDCGHLSEVAIAEGLARLAFELGLDRFGEVDALLHGDERDARQRRAVLIQAARHIAGHEHFGSTGNVQVFIDFDSARAIQRDLRQRSAYVGGTYTRRPQYGCRGDLLLADRNAFTRDRRDGRAGPCLHAERLEVTHRARG